MNKLLIHMMNAGDIDHRILPGLQKMQKAGTVTRFQLPPVDADNISRYSSIPTPGSMRTKAELDFQFNKTRAAQINASKNAERYGVIRQAEAPRSMASKAWAIATNPMTALKYKVQGRDIPDYFERGEKNSLDLAVNMVNPFAIIESVKNIPGNVARGEFLNAGLNTLNILPALSGAKTVGKFVTSAAAPTLRRAAQTAGNQLTRLSKAPNVPVQSAPVKNVHGWGTDKWNLENHVNSIFGPPSQYKPPVINRSGLTKDELLAKAAGKDKDVVSKMSEQDFQETVLKPTGEVTPYQPDNILNKFTGENEIFNMSADEYAEAFNSRLDLLNDIIRRNNKSGVEYTVDKLSPGGKLYFNTPKQFVQNPNKLTEKGAEKLAIFYKNPEEFLTNNAGLAKLDDGYWHFRDDVDLGAYVSKDDAISGFKQRLDKEMGPEEIFGKTDWNVDISPGQWRGTVEDVANANYYKRIPGLNITGSSDGVFADRIARRGSGAYNSINEYLKTLDLGRVKPGFNSQSSSSRPLWENAIKKGNAFGYYNNPGTVYGSMKSVLPYVIPGALGAGALSQKKYGGQPCYECGGMYADGGYYDCPDQEKDPVTGKCKAEVVRGKEAAAANKAANADMNAWAKQVAAMDKEIAKQNAAQLAGQLSFDYDWMGSPVDKAEKKAAVAGYKQFFQQNPNTFMPDDTSGYSPEQKYIIASKLKQRMSTPMGAKLVQQQFGIDPRFYDLQRLQTDFAPKMGGWNGMRNWLFNIHKQQGGPIVDPRGQWAHPGKITRIPSSNITMQGVPYPVLGVASSGQQVMMQPGQNYNFGNAEYVDEYPMMQFGGGTLLGPSPMIMSLASKVANYFTKPNSSAGTPKRNISSKELFGVSPYDEMQDNYFDKYNDFYNKRQANDTKKYDNSSNSINLSSGRFRGAKVAPAMINDIVNAAKANNVDPWVMLSLVGRESTFGSGTEGNTRRANNKQGLVSGWDVSEEYQPYDVNRYLADKKVPGIRVGKSNHGWEYIVEDEKAIENYLKGNPKLIDDYYKKLESTPDLGKLDSFSLAAQRIKKKGIQNYNPGDPKYPSMINQDMGLLKQDAALKAYMKTLGYKEGGEFGEGLLGKTVSCSNCGWSWKAVDGGSDPLSCHKCGGTVKMQGGGTLPKMQMAGSLLQPITVQDMGNVLSSLSVPQKLITKAFTGKYQTPSEAMDIKNPYGAFAVDAVLDPVNLVGAGLLGKMAKASTKSGVLSKTYKINPLAKKKPDVILTRTQKPGQTDELRRLDEFEKKGIDNLNFMERFEYKQMLNSELSRPGYGRGFSSDLGDISYYSYPNIQTTRGYEGFPEILKTRLPAKEAEKFNVGKNALQGYVSFAPKREFLLPKDMLYSAESFIPNKGYSAGPVGANDPGSVRDFVRKAEAEQRAANMPNWLTGYPSKRNKQNGGQSSMDSVRHQANKILQYEQLRGGPGGAPLPQYSNPKYMDMLMGKVYPEVKKIMPNASAMEAGEAMDFVFNAGFDQGSNKITKDPRAFALQEYYRQNDPSKLDADGKWAGRKNAPYSFDQEYNNTIGKLPENQRRILMNKGRDWYYKNINNPAPGVPNSNYNDTWYGRIWNTNDYQPFNPNNPNFTPKKEQGGMVKMQVGGKPDYSSILQQNVIDAGKYPSAYHKDYVTGYPVSNTAGSIPRPGGFDCPPGYTKYSNGNGTFSCIMTNPHPGSDKTDLSRMTKVADDMQFYKPATQPLATIQTRKNGGEASLWDMIKMAQGGEMIRRADGSYSRRGLWDNIRANKGSGKKPTKQMLEQERKIKSKNK